MTPSSPDMTFQQRVLSHLGTLGYGLRLLARLPADTVLVPGYSDGHTTISQVTLEQVEAMLAQSLEQLEAEVRHWQQPTFEAAEATSQVMDASATSE